MKTLVIADRKGGVGKTTLTAHLAYAAEGANLRVLLVDMDGQGSLSASFPMTNGQSGTLTASKLYARSVDGLRVEVLNPHLSIVRADDSMGQEISNDEDVAEPDDGPRRALATLADSYDLCLIDTPPGLGMHLKAALVAADFVVTPVSMGL